MGIIIVRNQDSIKVSVVAKLIGEKYAYEAAFKVDESFLDPEKPTLEEFFKAAQGAMQDVLRGKKELNAAL